MIVKKSILLWVSLCAFLLSSCGLVKELPPEIKPPNCVLIQTDLGPEDIAVWKNGKKTFLIISADDRRNKKGKKTGSISHLDLGNPVKPIPFTITYDDQQGKEILKDVFKPHGIALDDRDPNKTYLYVIFHKLEKGESENGIGRFRIEGTNLVLEKLIQNKGFCNLNDLTVIGDEIYTTNPGSDLSILLGYPSGRIHHSNNRGETWKTIGPKLRFPNGILADKDHLYVTTTRGNTLYRFDRNNIDQDPEKIADVQGGDNIADYDEENSLLTTAHYDFIQFIKHGKCEEPQSNLVVPSPSVVVKINKTNKTKEFLYVDSGREISAASTAVIVDNKMYIAQVYENYILSCDLKSQEEK